MLFRIDKTSLGVSRIGEATPRDDCPYTKSNTVYRLILASPAFPFPCRFAIRQLTKSVAEAETDVLLALRALGHRVGFFGVR